MDLYFFPPCCLIKEKRFSKGIWLKSLVLNPANPKSSKYLSTNNFEPFENQRRFGCYASLHQLRSSHPSPSRDRDVTILHIAYHHCSWLTLLAVTIDNKWHVSPLPVKTFSFFRESAIIKRNQYDWRNPWLIDRHEKF